MTSLETKTQEAVTAPATAPVHQDNKLLPLRLVIVGHVDHGKSSLIGRLLVETETVPPDRVEKVRGICQSQGKPFEYAFLLDALEEEQLQGITIDTTQLTLDTPKRTLQIIDAPGHKEFIKNMMTGAAQAELALLIVDAAEGVQEQTRRHAFLLYLLGIRHIMVLVNKLDKVNYNQATFKAVRKDITDLLAQWDLTPIQVFPISALAGDNITTWSNKTPWFTAKPLLATLEQFNPNVMTQQQEDTPARLAVQDVYKFDDRRILTGRLSQGTLKVGDAVQVLPSGMRTFINSIESWPKSEVPVTAVSAPQTVGLTLKDQLFAERGNWVVPEGKGPQPSRLLRVNLFWMAQTPLKLNGRYKLKIGPQGVSVRVKAIESVMDSDTMAFRYEANIPQVQRYEVGQVVFEADKPLMADIYNEGFVQTARCVVVDGLTVSGGGIVLSNQVETSLEKASPEKTTKGRWILLSLSAMEPAERLSLLDELMTYVAKEETTPPLLVVPTAFANYRADLLKQWLDNGYTVVMDATQPAEPLPFGTALPSPEVFSLDDEISLPHLLQKLAC